MGVLSRLYSWFHPAPEKAPGPDLTTAELAIQSARRDLEAIRQNAPVVAELVARSDDQVRMNHFTELARLSMGGN